MRIRKLLTTFTIYVIMFMALLTLLHYTKKQTFFEEFNTLQYDEVYDNGLPLNLISNLDIPARLYYKEIEPSNFLSIINEILTIKTLKHKEGKAVELLLNNDENEAVNLDSVNLLRDEIVSPIISHLNKSLPKYDTYTPDVLFYIANFKVLRKRRLSKEAFLITSRCIVHRESKQIGYVIYCDSMVGTNNVVLGLNSINVTGFLPEEKIKTYQGFDEAISLPRFYDKALKQFQNDEEIMQSKQYEEKIIDKQRDGLMLDLGISHESFK